MAPVILFLVALTTNNEYIVAFAALFVPTSYTVVAGLGEFTAGYMAKGGGNDPLRFYVDKNDAVGWRLETGDIKKLMEAHGSEGTVTYIEPTFRFSLAHFSSLGINLALGAIAVNIAWAIDGTVEGGILAICIGIQVILAFVSLFALMYCQKWPPDKRGLIQFTSLFAIFLGFFAMFLSFVALDPRSLIVLKDLIF
jgi:hypothetical protein